MPNLGVIVFAHNRISRDIRLWEMRFSYISRYTQYISRYTNMGELSRGSGFRWWLVFNLKFEIIVLRLNWRNLIRRDLIFMFNPIASIELGVNSFAHTGIFRFQNFISRRRHWHWTVTVTLAVNQLLRLLRLVLWHCYTLLYQCHNAF